MFGLLIKGLSSLETDVLINIKDILKKVESKMSKI